MFKRLKKQWRSFKSGRPGKRFEERYERAQRQRSSQPVWLRFLKPTIGLVLFAAGVVLCFIPGPGLPLLIIGLGFMAEQSRTIANAMDWTEVRVRKVLTWGRRWWKHANVVSRSAVIVLAALVAAGAAYGGFRFISAQ